jgi:hypothetical protein
MRFICSICVVLSTFYCSAHDYYFAFAEVEYKPQNGILEVTLVVTTHDFEQYLLSEGYEGHDLNAARGDSLLSNFIEQKINKHFQISTDIHESVSLQLVGIENQLIGTTQFYLSAQVEPIQIIDFKFDLLMDYFPQQQNKIKFIYKLRDLNTTLEFLPSRKEQIIDLY